MYGSRFPVIRKNGIEKDYTKLEEGRSIYDFYLNEFAGVDPDDGIAMWRADTEKYPEARKDFAKYDIVVMGTDTLTKDYRYVAKHFCGSSIPKIYGGFGSLFFLTIFARFLILLMRPIIQITI